MVGRLDAVARATTMFMLLMYGALNLACFILAAMRQPVRDAEEGGCGAGQLASPSPPPPSQSFRPTWPYFHWSTALCGFLLCAFLMFIINWFYAIAAIAAACTLYAYVSYAGASKQWGDAKQGVLFQIARDALMAFTATAQSSAAAAAVTMSRPQLLVRGWGGG